MATVTGVEVGGVTTDSATLVADLDVTGSVRAVMSSKADLSDPVYGTRASGLLAKSHVVGLTKGRVYWGVEVDGVLDPIRGTFRTAREGASSFKVVVAGCAGGGTSPYNSQGYSDSITFDAMRNVGADFFMHLGDRYYKDPGNIPVDQHYVLQATSRARPRQRAILSELPLIYHPDDHELGNNWSGATAGAGNLMTAVDQGNVHYPFEVAGSWAQTWSWGRVRFISLDARSQRVSGNILGVAQTQWLTKVMSESPEKVMIVDTGMAFIGNGSGSDGGDSWGAYPASQRHLVELVTQVRAKGGDVMIVASDAHMVAMDTGVNSRYDPAATGPGPRVCQFGPIDSTNSVKGGPYSMGTFTSSRYQFGVLDISDVNDVITVKAIGYRTSETFPYPTTELVTQSFSVTTAEPVPTTEFRYWDGTTEKALTLGGLWTGTELVPLTLEGR